MKKQHFKRNGFTLIEVVVVIIILVTLASIATPIYMNYVKKANIGAATTQIKLLEDALTGYKLDVGSYPETLAGLVENVDQNEKWDGPYIKPAVPKDPWGNEYVYVCPGEHGDFDLYSYGGDGQPGGEGENGDITNFVAK
ncbi:MAG: type II secretion system major pseudopilin GspG [Victivallales bacterium]|jgi:general secretion pathway protein G|nr:type II secretion system major pseudopilin GspG [Victivallales bacterium]